MSPLSSATRQARTEVVSSPEHEDAQLDDLFRHPGFEVLKKRMHEQRTDDARILANTILHSNNVIDQRLIDERRGFWRGQDWFIRETKRGARAYTKGAEQE